MGNKLAKDFKEVKLGHGHITAASAGRNAIVPDAVVLDSAMTIAVQKDAKAKNIQFFDVQSQKRLFITTMTKGESMGSVTKDARGNVLFITKAPNKESRVIFKASENFDQEINSEPSSINEDDDELTPVAKIEIDFVAACVTAFLSVKYKPRRVRGDASAASGSHISIDSASKASRAGHSIDSRRSKPGQSVATTDPIFVDVYKAVKIPTVKFGAVIVDMKGQVVGKAEQGKKDPLPTVMVAPGADASAIVALACMVNGEL